MTIGSTSEIYNIDVEKRKNHRNNREKKIVRIQFLTHENIRHIHFN